MALVLPMLDNNVMTIHMSPNPLTAEVGRDANDHQGRSYSPDLDLEDQRLLESRLRFRDLGSAPGNDQNDETIRHLPDTATSVVGSQYVAVHSTDGCTHMFHFLQSAPFRKEWNMERTWTQRHMLCRQRSHLGNFLIRSKINQLCRTI